MTRTWSRVGRFLAVLIVVSVPASAQVVQSLHIGIGGFFPRGIDSRTPGDVLVRDLSGQPMSADPTVTDALVFRIQDFRSANVSAEWNVGFGPHVEIGAGVGTYGRSVPTLYRDVVDDHDREIDQTLRLRVVPLTAVVRFLPFGTAASVQPYVGAGVSAMRFRYSEFGEFVDPTNLNVFNDRFVALGTALGGVLLGGVRMPLGGDIYGAAVEGRWLFGSGNTGGEAKGFLADKVDLGGGQLNFTFLIRF